VAPSGYGCPDAISIRARAITRGYRASGPAADEAPRPAGGRRVSRVTLTGRESVAPPSDGLTDAELLGIDPAALATAAAARRDAIFGTRVTFSPKVFIPLTMLCRDRCGYCTFAKPPARLDSPYLHLDEVVELARVAAAQGCHEALFTLGERPEERYPVAAAFLSAAGASSTVSYLAEACRAVRDATGLLRTPTPAPSSRRSWRCSAR